MENKQPGPCAVCGEVSLLDAFEKTCSQDCSRKRAAAWRPARMRHLRLAEKNHLLRGQIRVRSRYRNLEGRLVGVCEYSNGVAMAKILSTTGDVVIVGIRDLEFNVSDLKQHAL